MSEYEQSTRATVDVPESLRSLRLRPLFSLQLEIGAIQKVGTPGAGLVIGVVTGGLFGGPRLRGRVLPGGSDWQRVLPDGSLRLDCRIVLETAEGALIAMTYRGIRAGPADVLARLAAGETVRADEYYLRVNPLFETGSSEHAWLNRVVAVGSGARLPTGPLYNLFEVL
jgi:hypothetical protein